MERKSILAVWTVEGVNLLSLFYFIFTSNFPFHFVGEKGVGSTTRKPLHYKGTTFHRIIKGFMAQVCSSFNCLL